MLLPNTNLIIKKDNNISLNTFNDFGYITAIVNEKERKETVNKYQILSKKNQFVNITDIQRTFIKTFLYKVIFNNSKSICGLENHQLLISNDKIKLNDIQIGDILTESNFNYEIFTNTQNINLIDLLGEDDNIYVFNFNIDLNNFELYKTDKLITLTDYLSIRKQINIDENKLYLTTFKNKQYYLPAILQLTREFGKVLGYLLLSEINKKNITFTSVDPDITHTFPIYLHRVFPHLYIEYQKVENTIQVFICEYILIKLIKSILTYKITNVEYCFPNWLRFANVDFISGFFSTLIDHNAKISATVLDNTSELRQINLKFQKEFVIRALIDLLLLHNINAEYLVDKFATNTIAVKNNYIQIVDYNFYALILANTNINQLQGLVKYDSLKLQNLRYKSNNKLSYIVSDIKTVYYEGYIYKITTDNNYFVTNNIISYEE